MQSKRTELKLKALASSLKMYLQCFQQKILLDDVILIELHKFERYSKFKLANEAYNKVHISAVVELEIMRDIIVVEALRKLTTTKMRQRSKNFGVSRLSTVF